MPERITLKKLFSLLLLGILIDGCSSTKKTAHMTPPNPVVAHRGAFKKNGFPENSIASLKEAIRLKCAGSEFDVRMTADDSLVINHDPHYHTLTIEKTGFAELRNYNLSNGEMLPTLREYLVAGLENNPGTQLVLEIKPTDGGPERGQRIVEKVLAQVREMGAAKSTLYIGFDFNMMLHLRKLDPGAHIQYLNGDKSPAELKKAGLDGADYHFSVFQRNPQWIKEAKDLGIVLNAWTVNDKSLMEWLLKEKFEFITTNEPETLLDMR